MFGLLKKNPELHEVMARVDTDTTPHSRFMPGSNVIALSKPVPIAPQFDPLEDLDQYAEYERLAETIGYAPVDIAVKRRERAAEIARREVVSFLLDSGLPYYDNAAVDAFMDALCERETAKLDDFERRHMGRRVEWAWVPTAKVDWSQASAQLSALIGLWRMQYTKPVPIEMLQRAAKIKARFPAAAFAVTDYQATNPDPFISVTLPTFEVPVIFGVWDEPGFGAIGRDAKPEQGDGR